MEIINNMRTKYCFHKSDDENVCFSWWWINCHVIFIKDILEYKMWSTEEGTDCIFSEDVTKMKQMKPCKMAFMFSSVQLTYSQFSLCFWKSMPECEGNFLLMIMMTSSNGNIFPFTGHLCGEFTSHQWIPHTKASDQELWCFLWSALE